MAPSHDDHQETQPGHQETRPGHQGTQPPATPASGSRHPPATPAAGSRHLPGYRFVPTDCELIQEYLLKRVNNEPIPLSISDIYLRLKNPMDLAAEYPKIGENEWYFFTPRDRKYPNGGRPDRAADSGYWKAIGNDKKVVSGESTIGFRRSLVFYRGRQMQGERTNWIMHEFTLNQAPRKKTTPDDMRLNDWVLCRIHEKPPPKKVRAARKRKSRTEEESGVGTSEESGVGTSTSVAVDVSTNNLDQSTSVAVDVSTNNLDHRDHQDHAQPSIDQHFNYTSTATDQQYYYHVNNSNCTAPGQYYSNEQHEQQQPSHHNFNNNTSSGSGSGSGYGGWSHVNPDNGVLYNAYVNEQTAPHVTGFQEYFLDPSYTNSNTMARWNNEFAAGFLPMANRNSNASWNNESAAAYFPADDQRPPPPPPPANINNNSANYGGGGKRSMH